MAMPSSPNISINGRSMCRFHGVVLSVMMCTHFMAHDTLVRDCNVVSYVMVQNHVLLLHNKKMNEE